MVQNEYNYIQYIIVLVCCLSEFDGVAPYDEIRSITVILTLPRKAMSFRFLVFSSELSQNSELSSEAMANKYSPGKEQPENIKTL